MKFYRLHETNGDGSHGFEWFTVRRKAEAAKRYWDKGAVGTYDCAELELVEVRPTKAGILQALKVYADHADNG